MSASHESPAEDRTNGQRRTRAILVALMGLGLLLLWLVLSRTGALPGPLSEKHTITGKLLAPECGGGYNVENAPVEVRNEKDELIGAGTTSSDVGTGPACLVEFSVSDVPSASFYQITIGTHRGPSYSRSKMQALDWHLELSLGEF